MALTPVPLDTGIVYAYYDRSDDWHVRARELIVRTERLLQLHQPPEPPPQH